MVFFCFFLGGGAVLKLETMSLGGGFLFLDGFKGKPKENHGFGWVQRKTRPFGQGDN